MRRNNCRVRDSWGIFIRLRVLKTKKKTNSVSFFFREVFKLLTCLSTSELRKTEEKYPKHEILREISVFLRF